MKSKFYTLIVFTSICSFLSAQIGINSSVPQATFDINGFATDPTKPDGLIAPRLTGDELKAKDANYLASQIGAIVYVTNAVSATSPKTINITSPGYYYYNGTMWVRLLNNETNQTALAAYKEGSFSLIAISGNTWKKINLTNTDVNTGNSSLLSDGVYTVPESGMYFMSYEIQVNGVNTGLLGENQLAVLKNGNLLEKKNLDAVSINVIGLNVANVPVTSTDIIMLKKLTAGDQLTFAMKNDGLSAGILSNSIISLSIYKISN